MVDEPVEGKSVEQKPESKVVPLSDFVTFKKAAEGREKKLKAQLEEKAKEVEKAAGELRITKMNANDDEEVKTVKNYLLQKEQELRELEAAHSKRGTDLTERERKVKAKELVTDYKGRGVELDVETLLSEDDMDVYAMSKFSEHLAEVEKRVKETPPSRAVYESTLASTNRKMPKDMNDAELEAYRKAGIEKTMRNR